MKSMWNHTSPAKPGVFSIAWLQVGESKNVQVQSVRVLAYLVLPAPTWDGMLDRNDRSEMFHLSRNFGIFRRGGKHL